MTIPNLPHLSLSNQKELDEFTGYLSQLLNAETVQKIQSAFKDFDFDKRPLNQTDIQNVVADIASETLTGKISGDRAIPFLAYVIVFAAVVAASGLYYSYWQVKNAEEELLELKEKTK